MVCSPCSCIRIAVIHQASEDSVGGQVTSWKVLGKRDLQNAHWSERERWHSFGKRRDSRGLPTNETTAECRAEVRVLPILGRTESSRVLYPWL